MHRLNLTIDEELYEQARAVSFIEKKSISAMIRESLSEYIAKNSKTKQQAKLILEADDEKELLNILSKDEFSSNDDLNSKFNLWKYHMNEEEIKILKIDSRGDIYK